MNYIPLSVPNFRGNEKKYVLDAIEKEWVSTAGAYIKEFEDKIAQYVKVDSAVACQSGTAGIHLALIAAGVERDMEVIVPTLTFIAAVNPVKYLGAHPVFMDCDDSLTMDVDKLEAFINEKCMYEDEKLINKISGRVVKAIVVVHVFGNNADMERIMDIANKYQLKVIEDATEALGTYYTNGKYKDKFLGTIGDFGVYSFNGNKIITTGGGGMVVAKDRDKLDKIRYLSTQAKDDPLFYQHNEVGYNYRMTNLQAALGVAQLEELEQFISIKEKNYLLYQELLQDNNDMTLVKFSEATRSNHWLFAIEIKKENIDLRQLISSLHDKGVQTRPIWGLIHEQLPYQNDYSFFVTKAKHYHKHIINVPCSSNLSEKEVKYVVAILKECIEQMGGN